MDEYIIEGGCRLCGSVDVPSAKNAVLPIIACCLLTDEEIIIERCERLADIESMLRIIEGIGGECRIDGENLHIRCHSLTNQKIDSKLTGVLRSSIFVLGPLLARTHFAEISYPGGCDIGERPIDLHLHGLEALGVRNCESAGQIVCDGSRMRGARINLSFPSVGATENIMMAAALTEGVTVIHNAAAEPEIVDLQKLINAMGGNVRGAGSRSITVCGVEKLHGCRFRPVADRIVAGTYLIGAAMCGGRVKVNNIDSSALFSLTEKLRGAGCEVLETPSSITVERDGKLKSVPRTETRPFPGFPTDLQPQFTAMLSVSEGTGVIVENLFENRFKYTAQLAKMRADITLCGKAAVVRGVKALHGAEVLAEDLRGGAALVLAGLCADGQTRLSGVKHIDRGYSGFEQALTALGGKIKRN